MNESRGSLINSIRHRVNGGTLTASIFVKEVGSDAKRKHVFNVVIKRSWHDGKERRETDLMRLQDLPALAILAQQAYGWCQGEMAEV